jgi:multidrug resistance efflux pump
MQLAFTAPASHSLASITLCLITALLPLHTAQAGNSIGSARSAPAQNTMQETAETRITDAYAESLRQCTLRASITGEVTEVLVKVGDRVQPGQVLARIGASEIKAPYEAIVAATLAKPGELAVAGRHIINIYDPARMRVVATVPRSRLRELNLDEPVQVDVAALNQRIKAQKVLVISQGEKPMQMAKLYLELGEVPGLQPGQQARATFALSSWPSLRP